MDGIKITSGSAKGNLVCSKYTTTSVDDVYSHTADKTIAVHNAVAQVWVYDPAYTDPAAFKAAMSGVMLYYELATPVETTITPPLQALSTSKGFTSFSAPNSLTQNGPLSVTYYAEDGASPEKGWLTSYKRKLYMGRNIEWNQLLDKSKYPTTSTINGVTFTNNGDGSITVNGTATAGAEYSLIGPSGKFGVVGHKYFLCGCPSGGSYNTYRITASIDLNGTWKNGFSDDGTAGGNISPALSSGETIHIEITIKSGYTFNNLVFKPQLFDLTQMFGAGNEPSTPAEFWTYFDHKLYPYNAGETQPLFKISRKSQWGSNI